jgi:hypothetical protein
MVHSRYHNRYQDRLLPFGWNIFTLMNLTNEKKKKKLAKRVIKLHALNHQTNILSLPVNGIFDI